MVRRIATLGTLLILFLAPSVAAAAPAPVRLTGFFERSSYVPAQTFRFMLFVTSRSAVKDARVSFVILAKPGSDKTLLIRTLPERRLRKGSTRLVFAGRLRRMGATDGVYPVVAKVTAAGRAQRLRSRLVVVDPTRHGPVLVSLVWNVTPRPSISPKGIYLSRRTAVLVRGGHYPGYLMMHVRELARHPRVRVNFNIMPETLGELLGIVRGFKLREGRKVVPVRADSPEAAGAQIFLRRMVALMRSERVEFVPSPYACPALTELVGRGWTRDVRMQMGSAQEIVERSLDAASTPGIFTPGLRLPASVGSLYRRAGGEYTIVGGFGGLDPRRAHGLKLTHTSRLKVMIGDETATRILTSRRPPRLLVDEFVLHLVRTRLARGRRPTASVVVLPVNGDWRASLALVDTLYESLSSARWVRAVTLGDAVAATYAGLARARLPRPTVAKKLKRYYVHVARARRSLAVYAAMATPGNQALRRLERNVLIAQSALWTSGSAAGRAAGLVFAGDVTRTVEAELAKISIPASQTITLPAQSGKVPITVVNGTRYVLRARLQLTGEQVGFPEGRSLRLELKPGDNYVTFPVSVPSGSDSRVGVLLLGGGRLLGRSTVHVKTTYFNRMMLLAGVIVALVALLVVVYRKAGAAVGLLSHS